MAKTTPKSKSSSSAKKTVSAKSVSSKKLVNMNDQGLYSMIQKKAYELYAQRGYSHGGDWNDWFAAEQLVRKSIKK
jgi:hypothetical protein